MATSFFFCSFRSSGKQWPDVRRDFEQTVVEDVGGGRCDRHHLPEAVLNERDLVGAHLGCCVIGRGIDTRADAPASATHEVLPSLRARSANSSIPMLGPRLTPIAT